MDPATREIVFDGAASKKGVSSGSFQETGVMSIGCQEKSRSVGAPAAIPDDLILHFNAAADAMAHRKRQSRKAVSANGAAFRHQSTSRTDALQTILVNA